MTFGRQKVPSESSRVNGEDKSIGFGGFVICTSDVIGLIERVPTIPKR
jgi:hypothetical protein